ncbi:MAG: hypothetical protein HWE27_10625 [Gammaproteobacteria bacterium]|nr:hypothetical protein [Gammaproteobacteria bacterium]
MTFVAEQTTEMTEVEVLTDPKASHWLKRQVLLLSKRDLLDSLNDIEQLDNLFGGRKASLKWARKSNWLYQQIEELSSFETWQIVSDIKILLTFAKQRYEKILCSQKTLDGSFSHQERSSQASDVSSNVSSRYSYRCPPNSSPVYSNQFSA